MWMPKTSTMSNSNQIESDGRTFTTLISLPSGSATAVLNESGGNNKLPKNNVHGSFNTYMPIALGSRNSTDISSLPNGVQQTPGNVLNKLTATNSLTNELSQLSLGSSHGHSSITNTGGTFFIPNKGHTWQPVNSKAGFVNADARCSSSTGFVVPSLGSHSSFSAPHMVPIHGNSYSGAGVPFSQNQFQDENGSFNYYMGLPNDSNDDDDGNIDVSDLRHLYGHYSSVGDPQGQLGGLNAKGICGNNIAQHQKEHLMQSQQYSMSRSPGFTLGSINSSRRPPQHDQDSSISGTEFSFPTSGNQDTQFHGSGQYLQVQQPQFRVYNPLRGKEVKSAQGTQLGPDDYGLLGLLKILKGVNPAKTVLAMGVDPNSLGLELNSSETLHQKFASPWSDEPPNEGPKYTIPECYNSKQPPPLKQSHFKKFKLEMLFYIFYSMPNDVAQLFAANELEFHRFPEKLYNPHNRGWYYHKQIRMWFTRDKTSMPLVKKTSFEVGSYVCFDPNTWQTVKEDNVVLYYEMIEKRPEIPL